MPSFNTEVAHQLGKQQATERLRQFVQHVRNQYKDQVTSFQGNWNDNILNFSLTTYGFTIDGALTIEDNRALLNGNLPFAALPFRGKIEQVIAGELERELG